MQGRDRDRAGRIGSVAAAVALASLLPAAVLADEPMVSNRPGFSNVWEVVEKGRVELNSGLQLTRVDEEEALSFGQVLVRAGLFENVELRVGLNSWVDVDGPGGDVSGVEDSFVGLKFGLSENSAILVQSTLPTGSSDLTADGAQPSASLIMAWDLPSGIHLDSNFGISSLVDGDDRDEELSTSHALGFGLAGDWALYLEYAGFFPLSSERSDSHFLFAAVTYLPKSNLQFDLGAGQGLNSADPEYFVTGGVAYRW